MKGVRQNNTYWWFHLCNIIENMDYPIMKDSRSVVVWAWGGQMRKRREVQITRGTSKPLGVSDMFIILVVMMVSWLYTHVKTYQIVLFKYVQLSICRFYFNKAVNKINKRALWAQTWSASINSICWWKQRLRIITIWNFHFGK